MRLHDAEGLLGAEEGSGEIGGHDILPLFEGEVFEVDRAGRARARIVEEQVKAAKLFFGFGEEIGDGFRVHDVSCDCRCGFSDFRSNSVQGIRAASGEHNAETRLDQSHCRCPANAGASAGYDSNSHLVRVLHADTNSFAFFATSWAVSPCL